MVPTFIQVLGQLRCLSTSCLSDNNDDSVVSDDGQELITHAVDWQEFSLLFQSFVASELTHSNLFLADRVCISIVGFVINILSCCNFSRGRLYRLFNLLTFPLRLLNPCFISWTIVAALLDGLRRDFLVMGHYTSHLGARKVPELFTHGLSIGTLSDESENCGAFLGQDSEVTGRVTHNLHRFGLLRECSASI